VGLTGEGAASGCVEDSSIATSSASGTRLPKEGEETIATVKDGSTRECCAISGLGGGLIFFC
jgi:hypothetical protein